MREKKKNARFVPSHPAIAAIFFHLIILALITVNYTYGGVHRDPLMR